MAKPDTTSTTAKPTNKPETLPVKAGVEAPHETRDKRLPKQLTDAEHREVLAKVRSVLPSEADALESDREYSAARPVVAKEDKTAVDAEAARLRAKLNSFKERARELPQRVAYWLELWEKERHMANPGERQVSSAEWVGQKCVDWLNLEDAPATK